MLSHRKTEKQTVKYLISFRFKVSHEMRQNRSSSKHSDCSLLYIFLLSDSWFCDMGLVARTRNLD